MLHCVCKNVPQQAKLPLITLVLLCCSSAVSPEDLLELAMSRKLTFSVVKGTAKVQAQKWLDKKLKPKESLLSVPGVDYHIMMVRQTAKCCHCSCGRHEPVKLQRLHMTSISVHIHAVSSSSHPWYYVDQVTCDSCIHGLFCVGLCGAQSLAQCCMLQRRAMAGTYLCKFCPKSAVH